MPGLPPSIEPTVLVSWDGSGAFDGPHDNVTGDVASVPGVTIVEGRDSAQTLSPPMVERAAFELLNDDGTYSQHRPDSPLYQRVLPGRPVTYGGVYGVTDAYDTADPYDMPDPYDGRASWALGRHVIDKLEQTTAWGERRVRVRTLGADVVLTDAVVSVGLHQNLRTDQCVHLLLDACGWPSDRRQIATGDTQLLWWWCDERPPWDALLELLGAEGPGTFYVDRAGDFHWENRNYRTTAGRAATAQATFYDHATDGGLYHTALEYAPGYEQIYNRATYATKRRQLDALGPIWQYGSNLTLSAGESVTLIARPSDPFVGAVAPAVGTDYTLVSGAATVALGSSSGLVAFIDVTAGPAGAVVSGPTADPTTGLRLRGQALAVVSETSVENAVDASESIATYSAIPGADMPITLAVAGWPELDPAAARAVCDAWVLRYMDPRPTVTLTIRNGDDAHLAQIVSRRVSDRITVQESNTGLDTDFWINALELAIARPQGRDVTMRIAAERCNVLSGAVWDTAIWDDDEALWGT